MPIDYNTISYYYSRYLSNFGETVVRLIKAIPLQAKNRSNNTTASEKQLSYKPVLAFALLLLVFYSLFVKYSSVVFTMAAVMLWGGGYIYINPTYPMGIN